MDIPCEPICSLTTPCKHHADILSFFSKSCCLRYYMKRLGFPCSSSTDTKKMQLKDFLLPAFFQVVFDKLATGLIFLFVHWDRIHVMLNNWSRRLWSIQAQIEDEAGEMQWLRSAIDLACEVTGLLDEMAMLPGSEDLKETTRKYLYKLARRVQQRETSSCLRRDSFNLIDFAHQRQILAYECLPSIASTYGTQGEEDDIQLPRMLREKSSKWKKKYRPRKLYSWKSIKWKKKHPPKQTKDVRTRNKSVGDITGPSTSTKDNHDQLVYYFVDILASRVAAWMLQSKTEYCRELYEEKTPAQRHEHIHKEQSSPLRKGEGLKTSAELNIEPRTSATLDSTLGKITEQQTCMDRRLVELEKKLQVLNCIERRDASPICAQDHKRRHAGKLLPAKRQKTRGPEVAKYPYTLPVCSVPSSPVVNTTSNTPTKDRKTRLVPKLPPAKRQKTRGTEVAKYHYTLPVCNVPSSPVVETTSNTPTLFFCSFLL